MHTHLVGNAKNATGQDVYGSRHTATGQRNRRSLRGSKDMRRFQKARDKKKISLASFVEESLAVKARMKARTVSQF